MTADSQVEPRTQSIDLRTPSSAEGQASLRAEPGSASGPPVVASLARDQTDSYSMLGVTWEPGTAPADLQVQFRSRGEGGWSPWTDLAVSDHQAGERAGSSARAGTQPGWVGAADGVQVRALSAAQEVPAGLQVDLIDPGESGSPRLMSSTPGSTGRPDIVSRAEWGADESLGGSCTSPKYGDTLQGVVVHHTVNSNNYSEAESDDLMRGILAYHTRSRGWCDIGYNFLIDRFGTIFEGRDGGVARVVRGAHAGKWEVNKATAGISLIGRFDSEYGYPPRAMKTALVRLAAWKLARHDRDPQASTRIGGRRYPVMAGHRDIKSTTCPGGHVYHQLPELRDRVAQRIAGQGSGGDEPQPDPDPSSIDQKWQELGGADSVLGEAVGPERDAAGGAVRPYTHGRIYWSEATGAHEIRGPILDEYRARGGPGSFLGFPTTDVQTDAGSDPEARKSEFEHGRIYSSPDTGAHVVWGSVLQAYTRADGAPGALGLPTGDILGEAGGYPDAVVQHYQHGRIYATYETGAHALPDPLRRAYERRGGAAGPLGFPTSDVYTVPRGLRSDFEHGQLIWDRSTGQVTTDTQTRYAGDDRYATAATISQRIAEPGSDSVFVATGESFPDALAAGPAAGSREAPVLLTAPDRLPAATAAELERLDPRRIHVLGGRGAISAQVADRLGEYAESVDRLAGETRWDTAARIGQEFWADGARVVYLASGRDFADALPGAALAARNTAPVLLARQDEVPRVVTDELQRLDPTRVVLLGGSAALGQEVADEVSQALPGAQVSRVAGPDRYATSAEMAATGWDNPEEVFVATGADFPDALAGVPAAAAAQAPLLLTRQRCMPGPVAELLARWDGKRSVLLGGAGVLDEDAVSVECPVPGS